MDRVFLDSNILYSASYRPGAELRRLWRIDFARLLTSVYAVDETRRNVDTLDQLNRLDSLLESVEIGAMPTSDSPLPDVVLPAKDLPILLAAIDMRATHLLTGDKSHFGRYFNRRVGGVLVLNPKDYPPPDAR